MGILFCSFPSTLTEQLPSCNTTLAGQFCSPFREITTYAKAIEELFDECILLFKLQKMSTKGIHLFTSPFIMG
jgi:hypothetical protein